ncbi:protein phosphatase CheZ [Rhodoferax sp. TS-BS-61-7]|jgi:chemotaxis protein CheZ|uniref:protein phosphatase CheZ n=1 Tax=Rhodoferax sp. TS-BS-61-7 TaxID=2094194 RepID=UPI000CF742E4|nr:protein phosphatase CheZ [Rhodoferax sp. TS-BS-61-7]PQA78354.1 protein phosphatase CheZ [Rhodoferax sp. TS-BS-61-7]
MSTPLSKEDAFARLGAITREMHEALAVIGGNQLHSIVEEIPNARDRLAYVGKMTEDAANKVLTLVEAAKPECDDLATRGVALGESLNRLAAAPDMSVEKARGLMVVCGKFAQSTAKFADGQGAVLSDIMMAQDFQDLSGQVIKKVIDIITRTEMQLVQLLIDSSPSAPAAVAKPEHAEPVTVDNHVLEGPQTADSALKQDDVDDLLASLGF